MMRGRVIILLSSSPWVSASSDVAASEKRDGQPQQQQQQEQSFGADTQKVEPVSAEKQAEEEHQKSCVSSRENGSDYPPTSSLTCQVLCDSRVLLVGDTEDKPKNLLLLLLLFFAKNRNSLWRHSPIPKTFFYIFLLFCFKCVQQHHSTFLLSRHWFVMIRRTRTNSTSMLCALDE